MFEIKTYNFSKFTNFNKAIFLKNYIDYIPKTNLEKILIFVLNDILSDFDKLVNLKLVCKYWNYIINQRVFWEKFCISNNYDIHKIYNYNITDRKWDNNLGLIYLNKKYRHKFFLDSIIKYSQSLNNNFQINIYLYHLQNKIYNNYRIFNLFNFIDIIGGAEKFLHFQYIIVSSKLLDILYQPNIDDLFLNFKNNMSTNIARGFDEKNRPYIALKYKNLKNNNLITEILFKNDFEEWTYMGDWNIGNIGLLSDKNRVLGVKSLNYLLRMLYNEPCGLIKIDFNEDMSFNIHELPPVHPNLVTLFY